ncbi:MAG: FxsA family protein [Thermoleophilaceae bacterium]
MPALGLLLVFIVLPLAELYVIYLVGDAIGFWWTLGLLFADSVLGSMLLRSQGRVAWRRFQEAVAAGRMPHREVQDGVAVIFGGAFLVTPGFLTDVIGLVLLIPPARAIVVRATGHWFSRMMMARVVVRDGGSARRPGADVEGTAHEHPPADAPRLER